MLRRVDRIILNVPSLAGAVKYYGEILKLSLIRQDARVASFRMADGKTELVLRCDPDQPAEEIYYLVDDVRDLYARRKQLQLRFISPPRQAAHGYSAVVRDPFDNVLPLLDRTTDSAGGSAVEDAAAPGSLFPGVETPIVAKPRILSEIYESIGRTADDLPYTPHFEKLFADYCAKIPGDKPTRRETWRHLLNLRKAGKLPRLGEARSPSPTVDDAAVRHLKKFLGSDIGRRDRLPYTDRFEEIVNAFNALQSTKLSPHLVWRLVAKIAK